jgi:hypothetical protein
MRKTTLLLASVAFGVVANAQTINGHEVRSTDAPRMHQTSDDAPQGRTIYATDGSEAVIWLEDFANGIPSTWQNVDAGTGGPGLWEYRGAGGTQPADSGSLGAYASSLTRIGSPSKNNGFVILDSDYLDNLGIPGNFGGGPVPAPHLAYLITDVIDLSGETSVDLIFNQYYRRFAGPGGSQAVPATYVDFSIDGGVTFPYTITYNADISVNSATDTTDVEARSISNWVAGQANVKIRFRWDGDYYFWMLDDIRLENTPKYRAEFTAAGGAPKFDYIMGPAQGSSRLGILTAAQTRDVTFDCNAVSSGSQPLYNAQLEVEIIQGGSSSMISGPVVSTAWGGGMGSDTLDYNDLNTYASPLVPSNNGQYRFIYHLTADSAASGGQVVSLSSDTSQFFVSDSLMSLDGNIFSNSLGTPQLGDDGAAMTSRIDLVSNGGATSTGMMGVWVGLSSLTVDGGFMEVAVYDSSAFTGVTSGFDPNLLVASAQKTVTANDVANGFIRFDLSNNGTPVNLMHNMGAYYVVITMYSNGGVNLIRIPNDAQWTQGTASLMFVVGAQWYNGYSGSLSFNSPWIRMVTAAPVSVEENNLEANVYPNPTNGMVRIQLEKDFGAYDVRVIDMSGRTVFSDNMLMGQSMPTNIDLGHLPKGIYMINVANERNQGTYRISVE